MTAVPDRHNGPHRAAGRPARAAGGGTTVSSRHLLALGSITMVFGIAVLVWPAATLRLLSMLIGGWLIVTGVLHLIRAFRGGRCAEKLFDRILAGGLGIVLVVAGGACVSNAATGVVALAVILGLAWLLSGVAEILFGLFSGGSARIWLLGLGVASIGVGLRFVAWPDISSRTLVLLTGITALILGTGEVTFAWQQRHRPARVAVAVAGAGAGTAVADLVPEPGEDRSERCGMWRWPGLTWSLGQAACWCPAA